MVCLAGKLCSQTTRQGRDHLIKKLDEQKEAASAASFNLSVKIRTKITFDEYGDVVD